MPFVGQAALDASILAAATIFTSISIAYIAKLWSMRRNFNVFLRSPLLSCAFGVFIVLRYIATTYEYVFIWQDDDIGEHGVLDLVGFPALMTAEIAVLMTAARLLVMYYPRKRARWGRYVKEKFLIRALGSLWVLIEIAVWSSAWALGISRTARMVEVARPLSLFVTVLAAAWLACQLKNVHDLNNLSRDIRLVGWALAAIICVFAALILVPTLPPLALKYAHIVFLSASSPPLIYLINIRPVREVLRETPPGRRSTVERLLAPRYRRTPSHTSDDVERQSGDANENRLAAIMSFLPLRTAFGEFCRKSLCSESFEFLVDVADYKDFDRSTGGGHGDKTQDFAGFLAIVNCYIKYDSHSEINIGSDIKREILSFIRFEAYASLDPEGRREIFDPAEVEISKLLRENLLRKFRASDEYQAAVELETR